MPESQNEKFHEMLCDFNTAMLVTHISPQRMHARPMAIAKIEENCDLWFLSAEHTLKVDEVRADPRVLVICQKDRSNYLSLSGTALAVHDRTELDRLWSEPFKVWFPKGKDDPNICLIRVEVERGEYWDNSGINKARYLFEAVKSYVTGTTPKIVEGEQHGKVTF